MPLISIIHSGQKLNIYTQFEYYIRKGSFLIQFPINITAHSMPIMFWWRSERLFFYACVSVTLYTAWCYVCEAYVC